MMNEPKTACEKKESPVEKVDSKTAELRAVVSEIFELSNNIETFLLGPRAVGSVERKEKKEPVGWCQAHWDDLDNIHDMLNYTMDCLRSVKSSCK